MNRLPLWPALSLVVAQQRSTGALDTKSIANKVPKTPAKMRLPPDLVCSRRPRVKLYQRRPTTDSAAHPSYALYSAIGASRERPDSGRSRARALRQPTEVTLVITRNHPEHGPCSPSADAEHAFGGQIQPDVARLLASSSGRCMPSSIYRWGRGDKGRHRVRWFELSSRRPLRLQTRPHRALPGRQVCPSAACRHALDEEKLLCEYAPAGRAAQLTTIRHGN